MAAVKVVFVNAQGKRIGEDHHRAKVKDADIDMIFALREAGLSLQKIADKFDDIPGGFSKAAVFRILHGRMRCQTPAGQRKVLVKTNIAAAITELREAARADEFPVL